MLTNKQIPTGNQIGEEGTSVINEALKSNQTLTKLNLESNEMISKE